MQINYCIILFLILIFLFFIFIFHKKINTNENSKKINIENLMEQIKLNFNNNKNKLLFNVNLLPVSKEINCDKKKIERLFDYIFKYDNIIFIDIIKTTVYSIDVQKIHEVIYYTNIGYILVKMLSQKNENDDIFSNNNNLTEYNYLLELKLFNSLENIPNNNNTINEKLNDNFSNYSLLDIDK